MSMSTIQKAGTSFTAGQSLHSRHAKGAQPAILKALAEAREAAKAAEREAARVALEAAKAAEREAARVALETAKAAEREAARVALEAAKTPPEAVQARPAVSVPETKKIKAPEPASPARELQTKQITQAVEIIRSPTKALPNTKPQPAMDVRSEVLVASTQTGQTGPLGRVKQGLNQIRNGFNQVVQQVDTFTRQGAHVAETVRQGTVQFLQGAVQATERLSRHVGNQLQELSEVVGRRSQAAGDALGQGIVNTQQFIDKQINNSANFVRQVINPAGRNPTQARAGVTIGANNNTQQPSETQKPNDGDAFLNGRYGEPSGIVKERLEQARQSGPDNSHYSRDLIQQRVDEANGITPARATGSAAPPTAAAAPDSSTRPTSDNQGNNRWGEAAGNLVADTWDLVKTGLQPLVTLGTNTAAAIDHGLSQTFDGTPLKLLEMNWGPGGRLSLGLSGGVGTASGTWTNTGVEASLGNVMTGASKAYDLHANPDLSRNYNSSLGVPPSGGLHKLNAGGISGVMLTPSGYRDDGEQSLAQNYALLGKGIKLPDAVTELLASGNRSFQGGPFQGNVRPSASSTIWKGGGVNIERTRDSNGNLNPSALELNAFLGQFNQLTAEAYTGFGEGVNVNHDLKPSYLRVGSGLGLFNSNSATGGLVVRYERDTDTRNVGDPGMVRAVSEGIKRNHGPDGLLNLLRNEARSGVKPRSYDDPVRQQLITAIQHTNMDPASDQTTYTALSHQVNQAIANGADPARFAGPGGLNFGNNRVLEHNRMLHGQATMYMDAALLQAHDNLKSLPEGQVLVNREDGGMDVRVRHGGRETTRSADANNNDMPVVRHLNPLEKTIDGARWGFSTLGNGLMDVLSGTTRHVDGARNVLNATDNAATHPWTQQQLSETLDRLANERPRPAREEQN